MNMKVLSDYQLYIKRRNDAIIADFRKMRSQYSTLDDLYNAIGEKNHVSDATVRRVLRNNHLDGVQGLYR